MMAFQPHPTPPRMEFSEIYWAFPIILGVPMAWQRRRQAMAKWRWGRRKWHGPGPGPDPDLGGLDPQRHFLRPQRHLAMAWRRRR